jgi:hypothetical protein
MGPRSIESLRVSIAGRLGVIRGGKAMGCRWGEDEAEEVGVGFIDVGVENTGSRSCVWAEAERAGLGRE